MVREGTGGGNVVGSILTPLGAILAGGSFFLPYVRIFRVFAISATVSGPRIGGGLWLVPAAALLIVVAQVWPSGARRRRARRALQIGGAILGLLVVFAVIARLHHRAGFLFVHFSAATFGVRPAAGWLLSLLGFGLALIGALLPRRARAG